MKVQIGPLIFMIILYSVLILLIVGIHFLYKRVAKTLMNSQMEESTKNLIRQKGYRRITNIAEVKNLRVRLAGRKHNIYIVPAYVLKKVKVRAAARLYIAYYDHIQNTYVATYIIFNAGGLRTIRKGDVIDIVTAEKKEKIKYLGIK